MGCYVLGLGDFLILSTVALSGFGWCVDGSEGWETIVGGDYLSYLQLCKTNGLPWCPQHCRAM